MALINFARKEIEAKVVYYGPAFSGKTTNVESLHKLVAEGQRGELHQLQTEEERTIYFDYIPLSIGQIAGFTARFKLFTVPGQVFYKETRRVLLQGADAVVFVADSSPDRAGANIDALIDLEENLRTYGLNLASIPLVIQVNKRDVPGARPVEAVATDLNPFDVPMIEAVAVRDQGVMETLLRVTDIAAGRIRDNIAGKATAVNLTAVARSEAEDERKLVHEHVEKIKKVRPAEQARAEEARPAIDPADIDQFLLENVERDEEPTPVALKKVVPAPPKVEREPEAPRAPERPKLSPGPPLSCNYDPAALSGMRVLEWRGGSINPDGRVAITVVTNQGGQLREHALALVPNVRPTGLAALGTVAALGLGAGAGLLCGFALGMLVGG